MKKVEAQIILTTYSQLLGLKKEDLKEGLNEMLELVIEAYKALGWEDK